VKYRDGEHDEILQRNPVQYVSYRNLHRGHMSINRAMGLTPRLPPVATEVDSTCLDFLGKVEYMYNRRDC
jgi:hypothetical protein